MSGEGKRIVLVGHCGPDSYAIKSAVSRMAPGAAVILTMDESALQRELPAADLLLINRVLDGDYALAMGVDLVRAVSSMEGRRPATMLISNYPEAQAEAAAAGALPGFGKRDLYSEQSAGRVRSALGL
jgi:hypothetical protein